MEPEVDAVEPDVCVPIDAVEAQLRVIRVEFEVLAVPADAADGVAGRAAVLTARGVERTDLLRGRGLGRVLRDEQRGVGVAAQEEPARVEGRSRGTRAAVAAAVAAASPRA
ncbi:hypothetical protein ABZX77_35170 [Streptomyces sp. NPDC004237]|uniref:hypothetical protein n=1 Tax=Streptomyces sp. NPDC004237 TaxID=3154455 RepID=UPI0033A51A67